MPEMLWRVRFRPTRELAGFPRPGTVASERVLDAQYHLEGRLRNAQTHCLFQYTLEGEGAFRDADGEHRLPKGTGFLCQISDPATAYYYPPNLTDPWIILFFSFSGANALVKELVARFGAVYQVPLESPILGRLRAHERFAGSVLDLTPGEGLTLVMELVAALADIGAARTRDSPNAWLLSRAARAVAIQGEKNFNVSDLATELGVSREHLCRVFKREAGSSPLAYLTREKMRRACDLLRDTALTCKEVAGRLGYDNSSHFARTFKRVVGLTPHRYRRHGAFGFH